MDAAARPVLAAADCRALASAPALAIATVASSKADCSSIGNTYVVFDVVRLVRGENVARVVIRRPLYGTERPFAVGDTFVVAIEPDVRPAQTVQCVPLPAHEGNVRHFVHASSAMDAERLVEATSSCR